MGYGMATALALRKVRPTILASRRDTMLLSMRPLQKLQMTSEGSQHKHRICKSRLKVSPHDSPPLHVPHHLLTAAVALRRRCFAIRDCYVQCISFDNLFSSWNGTIQALDRGGAQARQYQNEYGAPLAACKRERSEA